MSRARNKKNKKKAYDWNDYTITDDPVWPIYSVGETKKIDYKPCCATHPVLIIDGLEIYGGSCIQPREDFIDIYVGLSDLMKFTNKSYPWNTGYEEFVFNIRDMSVPESVSEFKMLIYWLEDNMRAGKTIHIGCMGGHGRTGMVLAALVKTMTSNVDAITYVRNNYCKTAVETKQQINWLHKHFDIKVVKPSKQDYNIGAGYVGVF